MTINNFKPMEYPICYNYYFFDDTESEKQESDYNGKKNGYCPHCGWKYDLYQFEHPDISNLTNVLSLEDYKKWYQTKINTNPHYKYLEDNYTATPHICPVCDKYEFKKLDSYDICPYCGW